MDDRSQIAPDDESSWVLPAVLIVALIVVGLMLATYTRDNTSDARGRFGNEVTVESPAPSANEMGARSPAEEAAR